MSDQVDSIEFAPMNMGQVMTMQATLVGHSLNIFLKPEDTDEEKTAMSYIMIAVFLHQFCMAAKHKDKMVGLLEAIIVELKEHS